jgi:hypothetical protein
VSFSASSCVTTFRAAGPHARPSSDGSALIAYAEQSPAYATAKQASPRSQRRSLVERRRTAAAPGERKNANPGKRICSRQRPRATPSGKNHVESRIGKKMERRYAGHHRCAGSKATAGKNVNLIAWRCLTSGCVSEIAGATRSHAEARGDLHGCKHAYTLRRSDTHLKRRAAAFPPGRWRGTPIIRLDTKSGRRSPMRTPRTGLGSCRPLNTSLRGLIGIQDGCMMTQQSQRRPRATDLQPWQYGRPAR